MPDITPERWGNLYDRAFPQVYRALIAATFDRDRALDGLHDAFEEGLRHPPADERNLEGWLFRVALRKTRRGLFAARRETAIGERASSDDVAAILDRVEGGRGVARAVGEQREQPPALEPVEDRGNVVAHYYLGLTQEEIA